MHRRTFTLGLAASLAAPLPAFSKTAYQGPNVILVRFGGGVRRAETIDEAATWAPYLRHVPCAAGHLHPRPAHRETRRRQHQPCRGHAEPPDRSLPRLSRRQRIPGRPAGADRANALRIPSPQPSTSPRMRFCWSTARTARRRNSSPSAPATTSASTSGRKCSASTATSSTAPRCSSPKVRLDRRGRALHSKKNAPAF